MIPDQNKILAGILVAALLVLFGVWRGYSYEHERFVAFKEKVQQEAALQEEKNKRIIAQNEAINRGIKNEYENRIVSLKRSYAERVFINPNAGTVSTISNPSAGANEVAANPVFVGQCAETTAQLSFLQQWIREQQAVK